ncbi:hypothetical protein [Mammaliicoccus sp. Dog046]|uniref:hypothetical protein n=1 Tax=Mammaliicoccus sp. Dog046 TaxID=3034233 RepID=UPI002B256F1D|nr:hypothetical protein [Mammaliicoccus sp. Dog046]WQK84969.1 hypothetical protein P3U32_10090 [Mammaliicoccus sp. Dog046]
MISLMINDRYTTLKSVNLENEDCQNLYRDIVKKFKDYEIENNIKQLKEMNNFIYVNFMPIKRSTKTAASIISETYYSIEIKEELLNYVEKRILM